MAPKQLPIKISISGAPCAGKTTLLNDLLREFDYKFSYTIDYPRKALETLPYNKKEISDEELQNFIGINQIVEELQASYESRVNIHDKSLLDALAYWQVLIGKEEPSWSKFLSAERYSLVFICSFNEIPYNKEKDPIREHHSNLRQRIDTAIKNLAKSRSYNVVELKGSESDRTNAAISHINRLLCN